MTGKAAKLFKKCWALQRSKSTGSYKDYVKFSRKRNKTQIESDKLRRNFEKLIAREAKIKPKFFWKYIKSQTKSKAGPSPLIQEDGSMTTNDYEKAEELSTYFSSVFTVEDLIDTTKQYKSPVEDIEIRQTEVQKLLTKLKPEHIQGQITYIPEFRGA